MATSSTTASALLDHEHKRLREARKYRCLWGGQHATDRPVNALAACLQLTALKLNAQRCLVSLVDEDYQYFLAEATQTSDLKRWTKDDDALSELWMGCSGSTARSDALCAHTIHARAKPNKYAAFVVYDLAADEKYQNLPYVRDAPHYRFYAGTPLVSANGLRVGSLFIIENVPRTSFTRKETDILGFMAELVMRQLNLERESRQRLRYEKMTTSLTALVDHQSGSRVQQHHSDLKDSVLQVKVLDDEGEVSDNDDVTTPAAIEATEATDINFPSPREPNQQYLNSDVSYPPANHNHYFVESPEDLLDRAAELLRNSLNIGQVVFLDLAQDLPRDKADEDKACLSAVATKTGISWNGSHLRPTRAFLRTLKTHYSTGGVWDLVDTRTHGTCPLDNSARRNVWQDSEADDRDESIVQTFRESFPSARQIIYAPLWNSHYNGTNPTCLVINYESTRSLTDLVNLNYTRIFLNTLSIMYGQSVVRLAEEQKEVFLSNVSHELRTPLHGIIASSEILTSTQLDSRQIALCKNIELCSQTLLNTITQVLDRLKVTNRRRRSSVSNAQSLGLPGLDDVQQTHTRKDVALLCEETVDLVTLAHSIAKQNQSDSSTPRLEKTDSIAHKQEDDVQLSLRIEPGDWMFMCEPIDFRKILMNLVSNSLKFTPQGHVSIELRQEEMAEESDNAESYSMVRLLVKDSGQGMSKDFLKHRLYLPFSQESIHYDGLGLGLSIVSDLVKGMKGAISVHSELNMGTTFEVVLPFERGKVSANEAANCSSRLASKSTKSTFMIFGPGLTSQVNVKEDIRYYMRNWYDCTEEDDSMGADWIFISVEDIDLYGESLRRKGVIIFITDGLDDEDSIESNHNLSYPITTPIGPYKLASVFNRALTAPAPVEDSNLPKASEHNGFFGRVFVPDDDSKTYIDGSRRRSITRNMLKLPLPTPPEDNWTAPPTDLSPKAEGQLGSDSFRVLCVDDNSINLRILTTNLKRMGCKHVERAVNGKEALEIVTASPHPFDIIFMDLTMPVMDGFVATERIRQHELQSSRQAGHTNGGRMVSPGRWRQTIVALTSLTSDSDHARALAVGVDQLLTKPLRYKDLQTLINRFPGTLVTND